MSVLLGLAFACLGAIAITAMVTSLRQYAPFIAELRSVLRQPPPVEERRLTMHEALMPKEQAIPDLRRHRHPPKPIIRLLQGQERSPALRLSDCYH